jgi:hypothetical protein
MPQDSEAAQYSNFSACNLKAVLAGAGRKPESFNAGR